MNIQQLGPSLRVAMATAALASLAACASAQQPQSEPQPPVVKQVESDKNAASAPVTPPASPSPARPAAADQPAAPTTVAELQGLIQNRQVAELRTTYNGSYGASLLFKGDDMQYYVALFQQRDFWRVVKTVSQSQAESTYRAFVEQAAELAAIDLQRIRLQAENTNAEKQLAARSRQLSVLQADQALRQQQEQMVADRQAQLRQERDALAEQRQDARAQLRALQRQIDELQAEQESVGKKAPARRGN
ncbi:DUF2968 domain-containing protein [Bordetella genomosp. 13]|uniref:DUF2968 domain-containing protein n=1 Tax=Bordetella genomosp. 13 TaxID=463040 RepID=UPI0011A9F176|nr:DUF2968 domain-containing protein [Bordetella genomosp. 13]